VLSRSRVAAAFAPRAARPRPRRATPAPARARPEAKAQAIRDGGGDALALIADVLDEAQVRAARDAWVEARGRVDILVNAAGGNVARARSDDPPVFDVPLDAFAEVLRLNLPGSLVPPPASGGA